MDENNSLQKTVILGFFENMIKSSKEDIIKDFREDLDFCRDSLMVFGKESVKENVDLFIKKYPGKSAESLVGNLAENLLSLYPISKTLIDELLKDEGIHIVVRAKIIDKIIDYTLEHLEFLSKDDYTIDESKRSIKVHQSKVKEFLNKDEIKKLDDEINQLKKNKIELNEEKAEIERKMNVNKLINEIDEKTKELEQLIKNKERIEELNKRETILSKVNIDALMKDIASFYDGLNQKQTK